jgi:hypothetical protein
MDPMTDPPERLENPGRVSRLRERLAAIAASQAAGDAMETG